MDKQKIKVCIAVKTYPVLSQKHIEVSCTAGFTESGDWIRLYPIPFRFLRDTNKYKKYQWILLDVAKPNKQDKRPESYNVLDVDNIQCFKIVDTKYNWQKRKDIIFKKEKAYTNKKEIIQLAHKNLKSLVIFKPKKIVNFSIESSEQKIEKRREALNALQQIDFFSEDILKDYELMPEIPYKFYYEFIDDENIHSKLMIEDWEIGQLYLNELDRYKDGETAKQKVKQKYFTEFVESGKKDIYLFLGTTNIYHNMKSHNPYVIIGIFYPNLDNQLTLEV